MVSVTDFIQNMFVINCVIGYAHLYRLFLLTHELKRAEGWNGTERAVTNDWYMCMSYEVLLIQWRAEYSSGTNIFTAQAPRIPFVSTSDADCSQFNFKVAVASTFLKTYDKVFGFSI
jgi:hypothetical protein